MSLGIAFFKNRTLPFAIATETGQFFCGKEEKTFTTDVEEAHFFATQKEAAEGLEALKELLSQPEEKMTKVAVKEKPVKEVEKQVEAKKPDVQPIKEIVLKILGKPKDFMKIDAINVYDNRYRVNIWVKENGTKIKISDNFFVKFESGKIISCDPPLNKKYE